MQEYQIQINFVDNVNCKLPSSSCYLRTDYLGRVVEKSKFENNRDHVGNDVGEISNFNCKPGFLQVFHAASMHARLMFFLQNMEGSMSLLVYL